MPVDPNTAEATFVALVEAQVAAGEDGYFAEEIGGTRPDPIELVERYFDGDDADVLAVVMTTPPQHNIATRKIFEILDGVLVRTLELTHLN